MAGSSGVARPTSWELTPASRTPGLGAVLRIGARAVPLADVRGYIGTADRESDTKPAMATLVAFAAVALFFALGVIEVGWRTRFLAAAILFGGIALSALHDLFWLTSTALYRVDILTASGETLRFATVDRGEQERLMAMLGRHVARPQAANDDVPAAPFGLSGAQAGGPRLVSAVEMST